MNMKDLLRSASSQTRRGACAPRASRMRARAATALLAAATMIAAPLAGAAPALAADDTVVDVDGTMTWDVHTSWNGYVNRFGTVTQDWTPTGSLDIDSKELNIDLGSVTWQSDQHGFDIAFNNVRLTGPFDGPAEVIADITGPTAADGTHDDVLIASVNLNGSLDDDGALEIIEADGVIDDSIGDYIAEWADYAGQASAPLTLELQADLPENPSDGDDEGGNGDEGDEGGEGEDEGDDIVWEPELQVLDDSGNVIGNSEVNAGDEITVRGSGFDPETNASTRPPIPVGSPPGFYVVFGKFAPNWKPSDGHPTSVRPNSDQSWALTKETLDKVDPRFRATIEAQWVELNTDGTFDAKLVASNVDEGPADGIYGVYVYAAGGSADPNFEVMQALNYTPSPDVAVTPNKDLSPTGENKLKVSGSNFKAFAPPSHFGVYVAVGKAGLFDVEGFHLKSELFTAVDYVSSIGSDGQFSTEITLKKPVFDADGDEVDCTATECGVYTWAAHGSTDRSQDTYTPIAFAKSGDGSGSTPDDDENSGGSGDGDEGEGDPQVDPDKCLAADSGAFTWGIHADFLNYVTGPIAGGSVTTSGVNETNSGFAFKFGSGSYDSDTGEGIVKYTGKVQFDGHHGALDVALSNPQLHIGKNQATLLVDVTTDGKVEKAVPFAVVDVKGAKKTATNYSLTGASAVLTEQGAAAMQDFYPEGTEISPVTASFTLGDAGNCGEEITKVNVPKEASPAKTPTPKLPTVPNSEPKKETSEEDVPMCRATTSASLTWGVKQKFADYVTGPIANGSIGTANGVTGQFNWPGRASTYDPEPGTGQLSFGGAVTFTGHDGALNMRISNPRIQVVNGNTARLFADVRATNPAGKVTLDSSGVHIANLNVSGKKSVAGDKVTFSAVPATLTASGVPAFAEFYEAGSSLDALTFTITLGPEVPCAEVAAASGSLPRTGSDLDLAAAGAVFLLLGITAVGVRRRMSSVN